MQQFLDMFCYSSIYLALVVQVASTTWWILTQYIFLLASSLLSSLNGINLAVGKLCFGISNLLTTIQSLLVGSYTACSTTACWTTARPGGASTLLARLRGVNLSVCKLWKKKTSARLENRRMWSTKKEQHTASANALVRSSVLLETSVLGGLVCSSVVRHDEWYFLFPSKKFKRRCVWCWLMSFRRGKSRFICSILPTQALPTTPRSIEWRAHSYKCWCRALFLALRFEDLRCGNGVVGRWITSIESLYAQSRD
jgi:hypothetical protein